MAKPFLEELAAETGETANLAIETEGTFIVIGSVLTSHTFSPPAHRKGLDRSVQRPREAVCRPQASGAGEIPQRSQPQLTKYSLTDRKQVAAELARVADEGVAYDMEEHGSACVPCRSGQSPNGASSRRYRS